MNYHDISKRLIPQFRRRNNNPTAMVLGISLIHPLRLSSAQQVPQLPTAFHQGLLGPEPERLAGDLRTSQNNVVTETNT